MYLLRVLLWAIWLTGALFTLRNPAFVSLWIHRYKLSSGVTHGPMIFSDAFLRNFHQLIEDWVYTRLEIGVGISLARNKFGD